MPMKLMLSILGMIIQTDKKIAEIAEFMNCKHAHELHSCNVYDLMVVLEYTFG